MADWVDELPPEEREQWDDFVDRFRREALEKIAGSAAFISLVPNAEDFDVKFAVELGAAIMLEKPLIAVAMPGITIPRKLRDYADYVVEADIDTEEGRTALMTALNEVIGERDG